ncbi:MAG: GspE/PulE family protein [Acidobacteriota bacterium]
MSDLPEDPFDPSLAKPSPDPDDTVIRPIAPVPVPPAPPANGKVNGKANGKANGNGNGGAAGETVLADEIIAAKVLAKKTGLPYIDLDDFRVDHELFRSIPVELMFRYNFVPLSRHDGKLEIAMADPTDVLSLDELEGHLASPLKVFVAAPTAVQNLLKKSESSQRVLEEATSGFTKLQVVTEDEFGEETLSIDRLTSDASPMIKLVDSMVFNAIQRRASDIHIETRDAEVAVKYRIDGALYYAMEPIDKRFHSAVISRIKVMSELDIAEKRVPQDGRFRLRLKGKTIDFRVSIMPSIHGEDCVIRILDKESISEEFADLRLEKLGYEGDVLRRVRRYMSQPYGMILVTGPTGSGKTTTLYAALSEIKSDEDKIITIEDPVEYQLKGVTQVPVNEKKGLTFARGLRSILRHDPDKIMVGEIRDSETAQIAIQSALTGHLVFTTVHANNVVDVLGRFLHMGVEPYNFVSALNCILAQRLVRLICESCKAPVEIPDQTLRSSGLDPAKIRGATFYEGRGCIDCNGTGYRGRSAITELLDLTDDMREMIIDRRSMVELKKVARRAGMQFLRDDAIRKVVAGQTTLREINKVTFAD